jgi:hypothetical protein
VFNQTKKVTQYLSLIIIVLAVISSLSAVYRRIQLERQDHRVETVLGYSDIQKLAQLSGLPEVDMLSKIKQSGSVVSVLLEEETLEDFENSGQVSVLKGSDISNLYRVGNINSFILNYIYKQININPNNFYIIIEKGTDFDRVKGALTAELGEAAVIPIGNQNVLEVINTREDLYDIGIGVDRDKVAMLESMGFNIVISLREIRKNVEKTLNYKFQFINSLPSVRSIILSGAVIPGYPSHIDVLEKQVTQQNRYIGKIEFSKQLGDKELGIKIPERIIQVHTIPEETMEIIHPDQALRRYLRAVKERRVNMLYIRPFVMYSQHQGDPAEFNIKFLKVLSSYLKEYGYSIGHVNRLNIHMYRPANFFEIILMSMGVWWICMALIGRYTKLNKPQNITMWGLFFLFFYAVAHWFGKSGVCQLMALITSIAVPTYAIVSQFPVLIDPNKSSKERIVDAMLFLLKLVGIAIFGGLLITGLLSELPYLFKIQQFQGVKLAFVIPMVLIGVYFFIKPHRITSMYYVFRRILDAPIRTSAFLAVIFCTVFIGIYLMRSGNYIPISLPGAEIFFREVLEDYLYVRPRTKEFLIGYPVLFLAYIYIDRRISRDWLWFFATIGSVSIISVTNSFCHLHTPFIVTLYRICLGLVMGLIVSMGAWLTVSFVKWAMKRTSE